MRLSGVASQASGLVRPVMVDSQSHALKIAAFLPRSSADYLRDLLPEHRLVEANSWIDFDDRLSGARNRPGSHGSRRGRNS